MEEIVDKGLIELLTEYRKLGGVIDFKFFKASGAATNKETHLAAARSSLLAMAHDINIYFALLAESSATDRDLYFKVTVDDILADSGIQISADEFFGPYYEHKTQRPILLEKKGKSLQNGVSFADYYYYDDIEETESLVINHAVSNNHFIIQGYADAFLQPPHGFGGSRTNLEIGKLFLQFNKAAFGDSNKLTIYSWPTNCSTYFDAGKEWWGSFFWTVYNPEKEWYIGIAASTTD